MFLPVQNHGKHILKYLQGIRLLMLLLRQSLEKAAGMARMARRADRMDSGQDGIIVTVQMKGFHILEMSGGLSL